MSKPPGYETAAANEDAALRSKCRNAPPRIKLLIDTGRQRRGLLHRDAAVHQTDLGDGRSGVVKRHARVEHHGLGRAAQRHDRQLL